MSKPSNSQPSQAACRALAEDDFTIRLFEHDRERARQLASRLDTR